MARSYTTLPLTDDHGFPLINVMVQAFNTSDDSLVETAYTGTAGTAAFTALPAAAEYYFIARWGSKTLRWTRDFTLPTKQFFIPVTAYYEDVGGGGTPDPLEIQNSRAVARIVEATGTAATNFMIPHDFDSLTSAYYLIVAYQTKADAAITITSVYAAIGEAHNNTTETDTTTTYSITNTEIESLDISGILTSIAADDHIGIQLAVREALNISVLGVLIEYS